MAYDADLKKRTLDLLYRAYQEQSESSKNIHNRVSFLSATISLLITAVINIYKLLIEKSIEVVISTVAFAIIIIVLFISLTICISISTLKQNAGFPIREAIKQQELIENFDEYYDCEKDLIMEIATGYRKGNERKSRRFNITCKLIFAAMLLFIISGFIILVVHNV